MSLPAVTVTAGSAARGFGVSAGAAGPCIAGFAGSIPAASAAPQAAPISQPSPSAVST